ncbi:MAG: TetR/AcrR family transcriptional regulator [Christensenellales bacterium]
MRVVRNRKNARRNGGRRGKLFAQQGCVRTSVSEIVSAVDVTKGLFYYYFTTKDDMVKAVVEGYCSYLGTLAEADCRRQEHGAREIRQADASKSRRECFTAPLTADLCLPQHAALYADMCDRVYTHMGPALER